MQKGEQHSDIRQVSKLISYWLRHNPDDGNLRLDEFGRAKISNLIATLKERGIHIDIDNLIELNQSFDKVRWEIDTEQGTIRATHGHSIPIVVLNEETVPPEVLYHGTSIHTLTQIIKDGLLPMNRQFIHLSENIPMALSVARRHGKPFIIEVDSEELHKDGWKFYHTSDNVWLTTTIPGKYLTFNPWYPSENDDKNNNFIEELKKEVGSRITHPLYHRLKHLQLIWRSYINDDCLFTDTDTGKCYMVHLTWSGREEIKGFPGTNVYNSFEDWVENGLLQDQLDYYYEEDKGL